MTKVSELPSLDWQYLQLADEKQIADKEYFGFLDSGKKFLEQIVQTESEYGGKGIYYIEGIWGSGKSTFADIVCWLIKENNLKKGKKVIRVKFTPWYMNKSDDYYVGFLDTLKNELLQAKYSNKLSSAIQDIKSIVDAIDNAFVKALYSIFDFLSNNKGSIDDKVNELKNIIQNEYSEFIIVIILDEIDRLNPEELLHFSKILHFIKQIIDNQSNPIYCFVCIDSVYVSRFGLSGEIVSNENNNINIYDYYGKFLNGRYILDQGLTSKIATYVFDTFGPYLGIEDDKTSYNFTKYVYEFNKALRELTSHRTNVVIRNIQKYKKVFDISKKQFEDTFELKKDFNFSDIIPRDYRYTFLIELVYMLAIYTGKPNIRQELTETYDSKGDINHMNDLLKPIKNEKNKSITALNPDAKFIIFEDKLEKLKIDFLKTSAKYDGKRDFYDSFSIIRDFVDCREIKLYDLILGNEIASFIEQGDVNSALILTDKYYKLWFTQGNSGIGQIYRRSWQTSPSRNLLNNNFRIYLKELILRKYWEIKQDENSTQTNINNIAFELTYHYTQKEYITEFEGLLKEIALLDKSVYEQFISRLFSLIKESNDIPEYKRFSELHSQLIKDEMEKLSK